jgi:glycosyltransferase involved in cell wall biosynthesis
MKIQSSRTSVVIGTYNGSAFIARQLESLAAQTVLPREIIVSDDGSSDDTLAIVQGFSKRCGIPMTIRQNATNLGFSENFLQAAMLADGDFVAFCDQDDIWYPNKIARCQQALAEEPGAVLAVHMANLIDGNETLIGQFRQGITSTLTRQPLSYGPWDCFYGFSMVFDRRLLEIPHPSSRGIDYVTGRPQLAHDRWILFIANLVGKTVEIAESLAGYRQHGKNLFGAGTNKTTARKGRKAVASQAATYLKSALEQRLLVDDMKLSPLITDTQFDYAPAAKFWDSVVEQQRARNLLYTAPSSISEMRQWLGNLLKRVYRTLPDDKPRLKSALKDFAFILDGVTGPR